jgi:UV DNA damage repair endonuclease
VAAARKRQALLEKMAEKKEKAIAEFVERWQKKEMARIDRVMSPKK